MIIISDAEKLERTADERVSREHEVTDYRTNASRYTLILAALPTGAMPTRLSDIGVIQWTEKKGVVVAYKTDPREVPLDDVLLLNEYRYRDELILRIQEENKRAAEVQHTIDAVDAELPLVKTVKDAAIAAAVTRRDAMLAKATA